MSIRRTYVNILIRLNFCSILQCDRRTEPGGDLFLSFILAQIWNMEGFKMEMVEVQPRFSRQWMHTPAASAQVFESCFLLLTY